MNNGYVVKISVEAVSVNEPPGYSNPIALEILQILF